MKQQTPSLRSRNPRFALKRPPGGSVRFRRVHVAAVLMAAVSMAVACAGNQKSSEPHHVDSPEDWSAVQDGSPAEGGPVVSEAPASERASFPAGMPSRIAEKKEKAWDGAGEAEAVTDEFNTEAYDSIVENRFVSAALSPLSTFSVDVDTASYSNVRRFLTQGSRPPAGAVRIEELVNYFDYDYESPPDDKPFSVYTELSTAPWAGDHKLLHIGLQGKKIATQHLPPRNLVFLLDVSGSMNDPNKLPLLKRSLSALLGTMGQRDTVSIVVYAGASGMALPPTSAANRSVIEAALGRLEAGGSTNGGEGIELAYHAAARNFRQDGVNRVILATDGDFNVGTTNESELVRLIERKRDSGVFLTVLGFGMGNYKDSTLEKLADKGNGNYAYIDTFAEARKVLVEEGGANMVTIAKDVKIQVEMNPAHVGAYRLIGYENRALSAEDFNDDRKDAGEIGAGHTVTALYEILTPEQAARALDVDELRYQKRGKPGAWQIPLDGGSAELATVKLRYKAPQGQKSRLIEVPVEHLVRKPSQTSDAFRFSAAVAGFGMLLRDSEYKGNISFAMVRSLAEGAQGRDEYGYKQQFVGLVSRAAQL